MSTLKLARVCAAVAIGPFYWFAILNPAPWMFGSKVAYGIFLGLSFALVVQIMGFVFLKLRSRRLLLVFVLMPVTLLGLAEIGHELAFKAPITAAGLASLANTDLKESLEFLGIQGPILPIGLLVYLLALVVLTRRLIRQDLEPVGKFDFRAAIGLSVACVAILSIHGFKSGSRVDVVARAIVESDPMLRATSAVVVFALEMRRFSIDSAARSDLDIELIRRTDATDLVVLIIGESARADRFSLFGYRRKTTPWLDSNMRQATIASVAISPATVTILSVPAILTGTQNRRLAPTLLDLANEAGYKSVWISNQARLGRWNTPVTALAAAAREVKFVGTGYSGRSDDAQLLPYLEASVQEPGRTFVVLHLLGSHIDYSRRYPDEFKYFHPRDYAGDACYAALSQENLEVVAAYDNSIKYTDYLLSEVSRVVQQTGRDAVIAYVPDHGEEIYDYDSQTVGHGSGQPKLTELEVPLLVWTLPSEKHDTSPHTRESGEDQISAMVLFEYLAEAMGIDVDRSSSRDSRLTPDASVSVRHPNGQFLTGDELALVQSSRSECFGVNRGSHLSN